MMQITVKVLTLGTIDETITLNVEASDTISNVKVMLTTETGLQPDQQMLFFKAKQMNDDVMLTAYGIEHGSILELVYKETKDEIIS